MNVSTAISTVEIMNADKDVDTDKLLDSNNKIPDSPNNLDKVKSGQKTKKQKKDRALFCLFLIDQRRFWRYDYVVVIKQHIAV